MDCGKRPTLMVVDDNQTLLDFTRINIRTAFPNVEVFTATSCEQARKLYGLYHPEIFVMDCLLPDGDGFTFLQDMYNDWPQVRGVLVGGDLPPGIRSQEGVGPVCRVLAKPYEVDELIRTIGNLLGMEAPNWPALRNRQKIRIRRRASHKVINRFAGLLAGLRAFGSELYAEADDPQAIRELVDIYLEQLIGSVCELAEMVKSGEE